MASLARGTRALPLFLLSLLAACSDSEQHHHPVAESPVAFAIEVGGLVYQREVVDPSSPANPWMKNIGKFNGDDLPDLLVAGSEGPVVWYQAPTWIRRTISGSATSQSGSDVGDIDADGDADVVVGRTWFENNGGGSSWTSHALPTASGSTHDIVLADINGDGKPDITMRGQFQSVVSVYLQNNPTSWTVFDVQPGLGLNGLDVADVNGDGRRDIVVGGVWMENPGGSVATSAWDQHVFAPGWNSYASVKVIDMDSDGRNDIVLSVSEELGDLAWFKAPADPENGSWQRNTVATGLNKVHCFAVVDLNQDGQLDIAASEFDGAGRLIVYLRNGGGWTANELGRDALHNMRAGDIDNDGDIDLFGAYCFGVVPVILYRNVEDGGGPGSAPPTVATTATASPSTVTGTTTDLSVLGADDGGAAALSYTWATTGSPPGAVSFAPNGSNAARNSVATFSRAGSYTLQVTIRDAEGQSVVSSVPVTVSQTLTSVAVSPASATIAPGATQSFAATTRDQFAQTMGSTPTFTWSVSSGGSISSAGTFTAGSSSGGPFTVTATTGSRSGTASVTVTAAGSTSTFGETAVLGVDDGNNSGLLVSQLVSLAQSGTLQSLSFYVTQAAGMLRLGIYSASGPGGGPGSKLAETAEFSPVVGWNTVPVATPVILAAGSYWLAYLSNSNSLRFRNAGSGSGKWYSVSYGPLPATYLTSPSGGSYHWSFYGTIGTSAAPPNQPPTVAAAAANPGTVTGTTTSLSVLGADDAGESGLRYTWATTGSPPAAVSFSANGSNSAKSTTATFTRAGTYSLAVTIADAQGATVSSNVSVTVNQTLTSVIVTPASVSVSTGATQAFAASGRDQFSQSMSAAFTWTVSGGGTINASGGFTAGSSAGGPHTVTATSGSRSGTASVTVTSGASSSTFGETTLLSQDDGNNGGLLVAQQATLSQARTLVSLSFYVNQAAGQLRLGIYDATGSGGGPGAKRAETAEFTPATGWNTRTVITPVALPAGTYWLAYLSNSNSLRFRMATSGSGRWFGVSYGTMPSTFPGAAASGAYHWSFYATVQ